MSDNSSNASGSSGSQDLKKTLSHLPHRPPVDIEFQDLTYTVPDGKDTKVILKKISGQFQSGQLHAILGPSGAGKSTLLNLLAGYKTSGHGGRILVNGTPRNYKQFRKISRYIMQEDLLQPLLTVQELMELSAELKLSRELPKHQRLIAISEILSLLRLSKCKHTRTEQLSGGERKRLSIALELLNNPPVLFLDEPTTGLDDMASAQCIALLKQLAEGGRTIICSIHTPSAKIFSTFDNVYVISEGLCAYQGYGPDVVQYLTNLDLPCPTHYNPADYVIEVCSNEYGHHLDRLVTAIDNGRSLSYYKGTMKNVILNEKIPEIEDSTTVKPLAEYTYDSSYWLQFKLLLMRMWKQMLRDRMYLMLRLIVIIICSILVGLNYLKFGSDGSKTIFNFGFYYTTVIKFLYIPLMPVLLSYPMEIQKVKREYFNRWYDLKPYFLALTVSTIPSSLVLGGLYIGIVYLLTDQPMEWFRFINFFVICIITGMISESMGLVISSTLNIINGMFVGPCLSVPLMLLAVYGVGYGNTIPIPFLIRIAQYFSYLRYSIHGISLAMMKGRGTLPCPDGEDLEMCIFRNQDEFLEFMGYKNGAIWIDILALISIFFLFRISGFYLLKQRLSPNKMFRTLQFVIRSLKAQFKLA